MKEYQVTKRLENQLIKTLMSMKNTIINETTAYDTLTQMRETRTIKNHKITYTLNITHQMFICMALDIIKPINIPRRVCGYLGNSMSLYPHDKGFTSYPMNCTLFNLETLTL